ncbi:MAG: PDZ domain-containing protein [Acidobacteria bacterium]|nr:PDZ domain-containing protein [Acidobacteriota bacterium]
MKVKSLFFIACVAFCIPLWGQEVRKVEVFGGYSYLNADFNDVTSRQNFNGWEFSIAGNFNKWFAAEGGVSGYYKTLYGVNVRDYAYLAGPRINLRPLFLHALIGGDHLSGSESELSASQDSLAAAFGGGIQLPFSRQFSIRTSVDYVLSRHNILGGPSVTQNHVRASIGLVYSFGNSSPSIAQPSAPARIVRSAMAIPALGLQAATRENGGAEIVEIIPNGVAALSSLRVGDVINSVDGKAIKSPMDLAAEFTARGPGDRVTLGVLVHGYWQSETTIVLPGH